MAQLMRPISTITDTGNFTGATAHGSVDGTAPDTGDYWNGDDNQNDTLEVLLTDLSASAPGSGTCTVSIYEAESDTGVAPASGGGSPSYDVEVYEGASLVASRAGITATESTFTLDNVLTFSSASVTDWSDVRVRFNSSGAGGSPANRRGVAVSYIDVSVPDAAVDVDVQANTEALTLSTLQATVTRNINVEASTEALTLTALQADIANDVVIQANTEAITLTTLQATVSNFINVNVEANTESLTLTTLPATITKDINVEANTETLTLTTLPATVSIGVNVDVQANTETLTLTTLPATINRDINVQANTEALTLTALSANVEVPLPAGGSIEGVPYPSGWVKRPGFARERSRRRYTVQ